MGSFIDTMGELPKIEFILKNAIFFRDETCLKLNRRNKIDYKDKYQIRE